MESYYTPCKEFDACNELIERYWKTGQYEQCFRGHLQLAEKGYPLAECQVGYFYLEGIGVQKNLEKAFYWTERAAQHGDRDAQFNLATVYKGNIIKNLIMDCQSYTKYRPNETTGGIFVSWRRKEELPTGA